MMSRPEEEDMPFVKYQGLYNDAVQAHPCLCRSDRDGQRDEVKAIAAAKPDVLIHNPESIQNTGDHTVAARPHKTKCGLRLRTRAGK